MNYSFGLRLDFTHASAGLEKGAVSPLRPDSGGTLISKEVLLHSWQRGRAKKPHSVRGLAITADLQLIHLLSRNLHLHPPRC